MTAGCIPDKSQRREQNGSFSFQYSRLLARTGRPESVTVGRPLPGPYLSLSGSPGSDACSLRTKMEEGSSTCLPDNFHRDSVLALDWIWPFWTYYDVHVIDINKIRELDPGSGVLSAGIIPGVV